MQNFFFKCCSSQSIYFSHVKRIEKKNDLNFKSIGTFGTVVDNLINKHYKKLNEENIVNFCKKVLSKATEENEGIGPSYKGNK